MGTVPDLAGVNDKAISIETRNNKYSQEGQGKQLQTYGVITL